MKDNHIPYNIHSAEFPYVLLSARSMIQHLYHVSESLRISIASYTQDYTYHQSNNSAHPPQSAHTST